MIVESMCICVILFAVTKARKKHHTDTSDKKIAHTPQASFPKPHNTRQQQFKQIDSPEEDIERQKIAQKANRDIAIASVSLGLSIAGALFYAPLGLISMLGMIYLSWDFIKSGYRSLVDKGQPNVGLLVAINALLFLMSGHYVLANLATFFWSISTKLLNKIEDNSKKDFIDVFKKQSRFVWVYYGAATAARTLFSLRIGGINFAIGF